MEDNNHVVREGCFAEQEISSLNPTTQIPEQDAKTEVFLNIGVEIDWYYSCAPLEGLVGGKLRITEHVSASGDNLIKMCKVYKAVDVLNGAELFVKYNPRGNGQITAIPFLLQEKGKFTYEGNEFLVFDAFDGTFHRLHEQVWFNEMDEDSKLRTVCGAVLRQLLAANYLFPDGIFCFDFKPSNIIHRKLSDGGVQIMLIDMTESAISGDPGVAGNVVPRPMGTDHYIAPAFHYFFTHINDQNDPKCITAKSVVNLCDFYILGLELYYFLSQGDYLQDQLNDEFRKLYYEEINVNGFSVMEDHLTLVTNQEERARMAVLINHMLSWREKTKPQDFCKEVIWELTAILEDYCQLPEDVAVPAEYLQRFDMREGIDIVLRLTHSLLTAVDGIAPESRNEWTEYRTFFMREGDVCDVRLSLFCRKPGTEENYRVKIHKKIFLHVSGGNVRCRKDGEWFDLAPGGTFSIGSKDGLHDICVERINSRPSAV